MKAAGLVLEGGGNRGIFTAGVLDYLMERELYLPYVIGVSCGACNGIDYVSRQPGRTRKCITACDGEEGSSMGFSSLLKTGYYMDMDKIFRDYPMELVPFDFETYFHSPIEMELVVTNCMTGKAEYKDERQDRERLLSIVRASSSLPFVSPMVDLDGIPYLDGGLADAVPIRRVFQKGMKKAVLVLTRPLGYRKEQGRMTTRLAVMKYRAYPELVKLLYHRHKIYNKTMELIERLEQEGRIFVIRPEEAVIGRTEQNLEKLQDFYRQGWQTMEARYGELKKYLEK